jgi:hypothetical protein
MSHSHFWHYCSEKVRPTAELWVSQSAGADAVNREPAGPQKWRQIPTLFQSETRARRAQPKVVISIPPNPRRAPRAATRITRPSRTISPRPIKAIAPMEIEEAKGKSSNGGTVVQSRMQRSDEAQADLSSKPINPRPEHPVYPARRPFQPFHPFLDAAALQCPAFQDIGKPEVVATKKGLRSDQGNHEGDQRRKARNAADRRDLDQCRNSQEGSEAALSQSSANVMDADLVLTFSKITKVLHKVRKVAVLTAHAGERARKVAGSCQPLHARLRRSSVGLVPFQRLPKDQSNVFFRSAASTGFAGLGMHHVFTPKYHQHGLAVA